MAENVSAQTGDGEPKMTMPEAGLETVHCRRDRVRGCHRARLDHGGNIRSGRPCAVVGRGVGGRCHRRTDRPGLFAGESGSMVAVGTGAMLGTLYAGQHVGHRHHAGVHHRPSYQQRQRHDRRVHRQPWHRHAKRHHHRHHHGWKRPHAHAPVWLQPRPRDRVRHRPKYGHNTLGDCRILEYSVPPVIACRGWGGHWQILR